MKTENQQFPISSNDIGRNIYHFQVPWINRIHCLILTYTKDAAKRCKNNKRIK